MGDSGALLKVYLQPWLGNAFLMRLHNMQEVGDIPFTIEGPQYEETILTGTQSWSEWQASRYSI